MKIRNPKLLITSLLIVVMLVPLLVTVKPVGAQFDPLSAACDNFRIDANRDGKKDSSEPLTSDAPPSCSESTDAQCSTETELAACENSPVTGGNSVITRAANIIALATGAIAVFIILVAGITTTLSAGDASRVKASRDAIIYAVVGLVVIALARTIVVFIVNRI